MGEGDQKPAAKDDGNPSPGDTNSAQEDVVDLASVAQVLPVVPGQDLPPVKDNDDDDDDEDSLSDASDHAWDSDTLAAVARTTHHQMIKRQPILIGCNRDGSINVQLPNGNIIVAERSAFPKFDKSGPHMKGQLAQRIKKDQFAYLARNEKTYTDQIPTLTEIEHFLHFNASSVFHVFDRRVNVSQSRNREQCQQMKLTTDPLFQLDLLSPSCTNYQLLRAWAQDDPYRYTPPSVDHPTTEQKISKEKPLKSKRKAYWKPNLTNLAKVLRQQSESPSIEELRESMIQRGKHRRLIHTQHISTSDEAVIAQMAENGMFEKPHK